MSRRDQPEEGELWRRRPRFARARRWRAARVQRRADRHAQLNAALIRRPSGVGVAVIAAGFLVVGLIAWWLSPPVPEPEDAPAVPLLHQTSAPVAGPQRSAPTQAASPASSSPWAPDRADPQHVAEKALKAWLTRETPDSESWERETFSYVAGPAAASMPGQAFAAEVTLDGKTGTTVDPVEFSAAPEDAERETPVRWVRTATVHVHASDGSTTQITYQVVVRQDATGDDLWIVWSLDELALTETSAPAGGV